MLRLILLSLFVACASAIVCTSDICSLTRCSEVTAENCVGGTIKRNGGFCGCCDLCVKQLAEGESCYSTLFLGLPPTSECGEGLFCHPLRHTCQSTSSLHHLITSRTTPTCAERRQQILSSERPLLGQFIPNCETDGTYSARQCHGSVCYCADQNGVHIPGYEVNIAESSNMDCNCARDQYAYLQTGLIGKMFFCTSKGSYERYACSGSVCYCVDELGAQKTGSATVSIGNVGSLQC